MHDFYYDTNEILLTSLYDTINEAIMYPLRGSV